MAYADVETGNPSHNWTLSRNRVNAVADVMVKEFGIPKSRLILNYYGDTVQPYLINERNRVVIFIKYE
jgi:outer membrane protein OmpA-like peptidoglycan-associated protein